MAMKTVIETKDGKFKPEQVYYTVMRIKIRVKSRRYPGKPVTGVTANIPRK